MKKIFTYLIVWLILVSGGYSSFAQRNIGNLIKKNEYKGDNYFHELYYEQAIIYYELALKKETNKDVIKLKIADSYRLLQDYALAENWYSQVFQSNSEAGKPIHKLHYANILQTQGKSDTARIWYGRYQKEAPEDSRSYKKIKSINEIADYFIDSAITEISSVPVNTGYSELAPAPYKNGLVFLSAREHSTLVDHDYLRKVDLYNLYYVSKRSDSTWGQEFLFDKVLNTPYHEGPIAFYTGEDKLFLTRSNYYNKRQKVDSIGKTNLQLYTAVKTGNLWANIQPFKLNDPDYSIAHPALNSTNDTLYFISDMPGGLGGTDLYMSVYNEGWLEPVNLGSKVNTEGNELFPSFESNRLFFSSDGHGGLGGLDIYSAAMKEGVVRYIKNLGSPINSPMDDFSYTIDPVTKSGYFTSNRLGGLGSDDIYSFTQKAMVLNGIAIQEQDGSLLEGVQVYLMENGLAIATTITGQDGAFRFYLPLFSDFQITADKGEHSFKTDLRISSKGAQIDFDTLKLAMYKHDFFAKGLVYDSETQKVMHNVRMIIEDEISHYKDTVKTGINGLYSFVIEPGRNYIIHAGKDRFFSDSVFINTLSISKGVITNDFILDEEYIDKEIIFFDYNEHELRPDAISALEKTMSILKRYPDDWLIIGAHADARGGREYNQQLSEMRAGAVVEFFVSRGISRDKIIARGFGEGLIINRCSDGVNCREEDHSKNRRADIVVEEKLPQEELEKRGF